MVLISVSHDVVLAISGLFFIHIKGSEIFTHSEWQSRERVVKVCSMVNCCGLLA